MNACAKQGPFLRFHPGPFAAPQWTSRSQECCTQIGPFCDAVQPLEQTFQASDKSLTKAQETAAARGKT